MDTSSIIRKTAVDLRVAPNLADYEAECRRFSWGAVSRQLAIQPHGMLNIAWHAVDCHAAGRMAGKAALRFLASGAANRVVSYAELSALTNRFCNVLRDLGVGKGERLFILAGRIPELYIALLGGLKNGTVVSPLFSAFGPEPIATRVNLGSGSVLVTTDALYERKIAQWRDRMPSLKQVLLAAEDGGTTAVPGTLDLGTLLAGASGACEITPTTAEDMALLHFTSGTTGTPKGAIHVHGAVTTHWVTGKYALDLHADDIYWCTADPGWVTGTSYGAIAPLLHGVTSIVDREEFDAERWYGVLSDEGVNVWYTAPTAVRMLMKAGAGVAKKYAFPQLRFIASVGEPLNPEAVWWGKEVLGLPIHDNWWQTETGGIMIANTPAFAIKPGSMGRPLPGVEAAIVRRREDGSVEVVGAPGIEGELALKRGWPSMFRGYLNNEERYRKSFAGEWYLTGDLAKRDADGYYWFVGRADDVIKSAGHLIGPFEVESALMEHPAVAEAGVIGKPDPVVGEVVKAFVSLNHGFEPSDALRMELLGHARKRLGAAVAPKEIAFLAQLPRTRSGKIMRRLLKARELGLPEGDTSTLEAGT
ncbi:acetate--CoA ligase [Ralstonia solanacearum]|uniref:acetate--CoA ligase n=1 Tax=Ralstonia solanacearum TaxID=305 RepID=UPI0005C6BA4F|nr:acetate--CoA ligase [Ralstonia solanacearum]MBB6593118.1 acetate--CoA ligase [Ralstonia solanacearum]MBB6597345.1 acetate--CoA ligase [Ralstonia solanacearum]MDB0539957.1 acetate--CoA ligase [Ralstonia solanacearum]MDB0549908.1 acetate--CoA ligase [Ralstonia solanacearum]MDB0554791.1 acetate--CoA ligase [Ralstonia solanacearum]